MRRSLFESNRAVTAMGQGRELAGIRCLLFKLVLKCRSVYFAILQATFVFLDFTWNVFPV